jgi:hypothetical protein
MFRRSIAIFVLGLLAGCDNPRSPGPIPGVPPLLPPSESDYYEGRFGPCRGGPGEDQDQTRPRQGPIRRWLRR